MAASRFLGALAALFFGCSVCGDGQTQEFEECDDGNTTDGDGCDAFCFLEICGDGRVNNNGAEECDDGNGVDGDECETDCTLPFCGNGIVDQDEECDDGNNQSEDFCFATCSAEDAFFVNEQGSVGFTVVGSSLVPSNDKDIFLVSNPLAQPLSMQLEVFSSNQLDACDGIDPQLSVLDLDGVLLAFDQDNGINSCPQLLFIVDPGVTVAIEVAENGGDQEIPFYMLDGIFQ